jgi:hypothetical protein
MEGFSSLPLHCSSSLLSFFLIFWTLWMGYILGGCWVGGSASNIISVAEDWVEFFFGSGGALLVLNFLQFILRLKPELDFPECECERVLEHWLAMTKVRESREMR